MADSTLTPEQVEQAAAAEFNKGSEADTSGASDQKTTIDPNPKNPPANDDHLKQGKDNAGTDTGDGGKDDKGKDHFTDLLRDRNQAREEAAIEKQKGVQQAKSIDDLTSENAKLKEQLGQKGDGGGETQPADKSKSIIENLVKQATQEQFERLQKISESEKADAADVAEVVASNPQAEGLKDQMSKLMAKHPTISAKAAYFMLLGMSAVGEGETTPSNASKSGTGSRSKSDLRGTKDISKMKTGDLEQVLREQEKAGEIVI